MEIVHAENICIRNAVIISGLTHTERDDEVLKHLSDYGSIERLFRIDEPKTEFHGQIIVEFKNDSAMQLLEQSLPTAFQSPTSSDVTYTIKSLTSVYTPAASSSATHTFIEGLREISKVTGKPLEELLQDELAKLTASAVSPPQTESEFLTTESDPEGSQKRVVEPTQTTVVSAHGDVTPSNESVIFQTKSNNSLPQISASPSRLNADMGTPLKLTVSDVTPAEVQRLVVEHIVRSDTPSHSLTTMRLRPFSGKPSYSANEIDYDTWRTNIEFFCTDSTLTDAQRSQRILDSLLPPAADVVKHLGPHSPPSDYLELLESAFGTVEDGDELFAKFMSTFQDAGEKPSQFLHRLQKVLSTAIKRGGVSAADRDRHLLKQFCRGCWDNALITELQLEQKRKNPPAFSDLLLLLRIEEDKQSIKAVRMNQHLGAAKHSATPPRRVVTNLHSISAACSAVKHDEVEDLKRQVVELQNQIASMKPFKKCKEFKPKEPSVPSKSAKTFSPKPSKGTNPQPNKSAKPRPWYCFNCGEDGHIASRCETSPNPSLVGAKNRQLKEKQLQWEVCNGVPDPNDLN